MNNDSFNTKKLINFPPQLVAQIEAYRQEHMLPSFTSAVIVLVQRGLKNESDSSNS